MKNDTPQEEIQLIHHDFDVPVKFIEGYLEARYYGGGEEFPTGWLNITLEGSASLAMYLEEKKLVTKDNANYWELPFVKVLHSQPYADSFGILDKPSEEIALSDISKYVEWVQGKPVQLELTDKYYVVINFHPSSQTSLDQFKISATFIHKSLPGTFLPDLIEAVHKLGYILFQQGVGLQAEGLPTKIYTSGEDYYVEHPDFGRLPGGIEYIDLRAWNGENWQFSQADVKITG